MISRLFYCFVFCLLSVTANAAGFQSQSGLSKLESAEFLPVEQAYQLELEVADNGKTLTMIWLLGDGYYLYHHGFKLQWHLGNEELHNLGPEALALPDGIKKEDEYFGQVETYYRQLVYAQDFATEKNQTL